MSLRALSLVFVALCAGCTGIEARQGSGAEFESRHRYESEVAARAATTRLKSEETLQKVRAFLQDTTLPEGGETRVRFAQGSLQAGNEQRVSAEKWFQHPTGHWLADVALIVRVEGQRVVWKAATRVTGFDPATNALVADVYGLRAMWVAGQVARE